MNIFIDTEPLHLYPYSGISIYTYHLISSLNNFFPNLKLHSAFATIRYSIFKRIHSAITNGNLKIDFSCIPLPGRLAGKYPFLANLLSLPPQKQCDLIHAVAFIPPKWLKTSNKKLILTIHDLAFLRHPNKKYVPSSDCTNELIISQFVKKADLIIADSLFTKNEISELLKYPENKIMVAYPGSQFEDMIEKTNITNNDNILKKYNLLNKSYFITTSTLSPRKNYETLLKAFEQFQQTHKDSFLLIIGSNGWDCLPLIEKIHKMKSRVIWLKNVPTDELWALYKNAIACFMISHYEGFGIPVLEAMQADCPVCISTGSSLEEIAGEAAIKIAPIDIEGAINAFQTFLEKKEFRQNLIHKGKEQSKKFTWKKCAENTVCAYKNIIQQS